MLTVILMAQMAFGMLAMTLCLPSMQEWAAIFGTPQTHVQLTLGLYLLSYGGCQLLYGPLSDRHGRRPMLMVGLGLALAGSLLAAQAATIEWLLAARLLQGAGTAACMVVGRASVQDLFSGPERTRIMAYVGMTMGLCPPLGTVIGGQMHVHFGWASNFWLMAGLAVLLMAAAWRGLPAGQPRHVPIAEPIHWLRAMGQAYAQLARERAFLLNVAILALSSAAFYAFLGAAPLVLKGYGIGPGQVGVYIMLAPLSYIAGNYLTSHLVRHRGERWMRNAGQILTLAGIGIMLALALIPVPSPWAFALPLSLMGVGHGLLIPPTLAATVGLVPALAGAAAAVAGVMQQLVGALGGYSVGWVSLATPVPLGLLMGGFTLAAVAAQVLLHRR
jgi:MFS transporter, DHA1 family, multidrug resistance protein